MIKIKIICVGKVKERYFKEAVFEYQKRLSKYCKLEIIEVKEESISLKDNLDEAIKTTEGNAILKRIESDEYVILLDVNGEELTSQEFASKMQKLIDNGKGKITFLIGGSLGVSKEVEKRSDHRLCFSKMTFLHQMIRIFLLEQIYRGFKINNNETYQK